MLVEGSSVQYKRYADYFEHVPVNDRWESTQIGRQREHAGRVTLESLANGLEAETMDLVDQPEVHPSAIRVRGPFEVICQVFSYFGKAPNLKGALKADVDPDELTLRLTSEPFPLRTYKRIVVKVVDVYGKESTVVRALSGGR